MQGIDAGNSLIHEKTNGRIMENTTGYQWVSASSKGKQKHRGFWRRAAVTWQDPTPRQAAQRLRMSETAIRFRGVKGTVKMPDGTRIPANCILTGALTQGSPSPEILPTPPAVPLPASWTGKKVAVILLP